MNLRQADRIERSSVETGPGVERPATPSACEETGKCGSRRWIPIGGGESHPDDRSDSQAPRSKSGGRASRGQADRDKAGLSSWNAAGIAHRFGAPLATVLSASSEDAIKSDPEISLELERPDWARVSTSCSRLKRLSRRCRFQFRWVCCFCQFYWRFWIGNRTDKRASLELV